MWPIQTSSIVPLFHCLFKTNTLYFFFTSIYIHFFFIPAADDQAILAENAHYIETVLTILRINACRQTHAASNTKTYLALSKNSSFSRWNHSAGSNDLQSMLIVPEGTPQRMLKRILLCAPTGHRSYDRGEAVQSPEPSDDGEGTSRSRREPSGSHVLKERRRREKLNERFVMLRSLVPFVTKVRTYIYRTMRSKAMQVRVRLHSIVLQFTAYGKKLILFPLLLTDGQGLDPGRHDRVREAATETHPGPRITSSAGSQQSEDDDGAAPAGSLNGEERSPSHQRRSLLPRARRHSSGSERQLLQQQRRGASGARGGRHGDGRAGVHHRERRAGGAPVPAQGRAPPPGHDGAAPGAPAGGHLRPGVVSRRRATCRAACKGWKCHGNCLPFFFGCVTDLIAGVLSEL